MYIEIGKYVLSSDSCNFIISDPYDVTAKKINRENPSYHCTIESAINGVLKRRMRKSDATTLIELKNELAAHRTELTSIFKEII